LTWQWRKNGVNLTDGGHVAGSASRILTVNNISMNDAAAYAVVVGNALGSVTSSNATLTVIGPPVLESVAQGGGMLVFTWANPTRCKARPTWLPPTGPTRAASSRPPTPV
jgi:hypothetical protein